VQLTNEKKSKAVGIVTIDLGKFISEQESDPAPKVQTMPLEKCPDKNSTIEFSLKTILVNANATG
jgi:hypothetical protein